jgi:hypothetical protein
MCAIAGWSLITARQASAAVGIGESALFSLNTTYVADRPELEVLSAGMSITSMGGGQDLIAGQPDLPAEEILYITLKYDGDEIPAWLFDQINPPQPAGGARQGGDTRAEAVAIPFSLGGTYSNPGTTAGYANDYDSNVEASFCREKLPAKLPTS